MISKLLEIMLVASIISYSSHVFSQNCSPGSPGYVNIDFETDGFGNPLTLGQVIDENTYANLGIEMTVSNVTGIHPLVIFDTSNPTGGDCDLGTPSFNCPSNNSDTTDNCTGEFPGQSNDGSGQNNCVPLENIVIISENYPYSTIGAPDPDPDDLGGGGTITLTFDNPYSVSEIGIVDDAEGDFLATYANGTTESIPFNGGGDNDVATFYLELTDVVKFEINLIGSGGFSSFVLCDEYSASAGDQLFVDVDNDGVYDPTKDSPIANVTVDLTLPDGSVISTETDENGNYLFKNLAGGSFTVDVDVTDPDFPSGVENSVIPTGGTTNENTFSLNDGETRMDQDFGYRGTAAVGDQLFVDVDNDGNYDPAIDSPIGNVTVKLTTSSGVEFTTETDASGNYLFDHLVGDAYTVEVDVLDVDFPSGVENSVIPTGGTTNENTFSLNDGETRLDQDFGYRGTAAVGDQLFVDVDNDGNYDPAIDSPIGNVTVKLTTSSGVEFTTETDASGNYLFDHLVGDAYTVEVDVLDVDFPSGVENSVIPTGGTTNENTFSLNDGETRMDQDFGYRGTASLGDQLFIDVNGDNVFTPGIDEVISNVDVLLTNSAGVQRLVTSDENGVYWFDHLLPDTYTVTVDGNDNDFPNNIKPTVDVDGVNTPNTAMVTITAGSSTDEIDFGYQPLGTIGDQLFVDEDGDGNYDPSIDSPISNVSVTLTYPDGSSITEETDEMGNYLFQELSSGNFTVTVDVTDPDFPESVVNTVDPEGDNNSTSNLDLGIGEDNMDQDFGYLGQSLPVEYLFIAAERHEEGALIKWATATEVNSYKFEILRSLDGKNFIKIGETEAAFNSVEERNYSFLDRDAYGQVYYRLNQIDVDGTSELSAIVSVRLNEKVEVSVFPNPTSDLIYISFENKRSAATIQLIQPGNGIIVRSLTTDQNNARLDLSDLPQGYYILYIIDENVNVRTVKKVVKL